MPGCRLQGLRAYTTQTHQKSSIIFCQMLVMLAYITLFRVCQPLSQSLAMLVPRAYNTPCRACQMLAILDLYVNFQLLNAQCSMLNAQCSMLNAQCSPVIPYFAGHVKTPMQNSAYTTTRERMQAHNTTKTGTSNTSARTCQALQEHARTCENLREPAYTTQESTCQSSTCKSPASLYHKGNRMSRGAQKQCNVKQYIFMQSIDMFWQGMV